VWPWVRPQRMPGFAGPPFPPQHPDAGGLDHPSQWGENFPGFLPAHFRKASRFAPARAAQFFFVFWKFAARSAPRQKGPPASARLDPPPRSAPRLETAADENPFASLRGRSPGCGFEGRHAPQRQRRKLRSREPSGKKTLGPENANGPNQLRPRPPGFSGQAKRALSGSFWSCNVPPPHSAYPLRYGVYFSGDKTRKVFAWTAGSPFSFFSRKRPGQEKTPPGML